MPARIRCPAARGLGAAMGPSSTIASRSATLLWPATLAASTTTARQYASMVESAFAGMSTLRLPDDYVPPTKPPTARPSDVRKSQLLRTYTSLLRSTPLILIFQHSNLTATEWSAIRRELNIALANVSPPGTDAAEIASKVQLQVIRTRIFDVALKLVEFYDPSKVASTTASTASGKKVKVTYNHDLSKAAYEAVQAVTKGDTPLPATSRYAELSPLMVGPVALLTLPAVSPDHLAAALSVLSPSPPAFPAPSRRKSPGYYDPIAQSGLQKLMLIGGRIEGKVFDIDGVRWVGGIKGGLDSLRAQLVGMLQNAGLGLTSVLEGAGKSLWLTMESRKVMMEEAEKPAVEEAEKVVEVEKE
ncbi:hypothetical protein B0T22DRAFT_150731 [Podospora appendiculata]|uniref:Uncharacterized protein n=1 Tax=Podospora appendiculata TaxID=314037 RepID=A0AAE1CCB0_9PEZI|nr:hypothetical protein B0T22DRAFT_150731 [Podospora appendiculata]